MFSSQLLGYTKVKSRRPFRGPEVCADNQPDPRVYRRALEILDRRPEEVAMVAAHAYDLRAAKKVYVQFSNWADICRGMRTIYIHRDTEDPLEDEEEMRTEFDLYIDGRAEVGAEGGLVRLADILSKR